MSTQHTREWSKFLENGLLIHFRNMLAHAPIQGIQDIMVTQGWVKPGVVLLDTENGWTWWIQVVGGNGGAANKSRHPCDGEL